MLVIFSSDNGGPADHANNWPLRGSKGSDFEGGTRVCAFRPRRPGAVKCP